MTDIEYPKITCGQPCPPDVACPECEVYWQQMREEGYWKDGEGWTEKAQREWRKLFP